MLRGSILGVVVLLIALSSASARSDLATGNYVVYASRVASREQAMFLIKVEKKNGKAVAEVLDPAATASVEKITVENGKVEIAFKSFGRAVSFEGSVSEKNPKLILGNYNLEDDRQVIRCVLIQTEKHSLDQEDRVRVVRLPEPMSKVQQLNNKVLQLRVKLRQASGDARVELNRQIADAQKDADQKVPLLCKEVLEKHPESPAVIDAAMVLLPKAAKIAKPEEVTAWLKTLDAVAKPYGTRYSLDVASRSLTALSKQKGLEQVALEESEKAAKAVTKTKSLGLQIRVLKAVLAVQENAGKSELARQTATQVAKLEEPLDKEYLARVPPFKPDAYQGRKSSSDRVAVLELFTGAQCPPCVAADVAFDALQKSYKPADLILIQYHMHIPGPDPLTNTDSEARWKYYGNLRGTPSALFNGKLAPGGGGGMPASQIKYADYKKIIDELLEKPTTIKLGGNVAAKGDKLSVKIQVSGIEEPSEKLKLRLLLVEESIKYVGGNGLRFHHQVVRAMPGGVDGMVLKEKSAAKTAQIDLAEVRANLTRYLDNYAKTRDFPYPERPLALKHLRVIALVQDDDSKEILQAVQLEVPAGK